MASTPPPYTTDSHNYNSIVGQQTMPVPAIPDPLASPIDTSDSSMVSVVSAAKKNFKRVLPVVIVLALVIVIYFVWNSSTSVPPSTGPSVTQQNFSNSSPATTNSST